MRTHSRENWIFKIVRSLILDIFLLVCFRHWKAGSTSGYNVVNSPRVLTDIKDVVLGATLLVKLFSWLGATACQSVYFGAFLCTRTTRHITLHRAAPCCTGCLLYFVAFVYAVNAFI